MARISAGKILKVKFEEILYPSLLELNFKPHPSPEYVNGAYIRDGGGGYDYQMIMIKKKHIFVSATISIFHSTKSLRAQFYIGENSKINLIKEDYSIYNWEKLMNIIPFANYNIRGNGKFELIPSTLKRFNPFELDIFSIKFDPHSVDKTKEDAEALMYRIKNLVMTSLKMFIDEGVADRHISLDVEFRKFLRTEKPFWI